MNDQSLMMSQQQQKPPMMSQQLPPMMTQSQVINPMTQGMNSVQLGHGQPMNQPPMMVMNPMTRGGYKPWTVDPTNYGAALNFNSNNFVASNKSRIKNNKNNWKGKNVNKNKEQQRNPITSGSGGYKPPSLNELQAQNRMKARKYYYNPNKKKYNNRFAPYAPRNTTSFIIRAKRSGGIASLVSPCPVTPAVLPTPIISPSTEVLGDMAKEEWGVDGYGSMKGLIRLRSPGNEEEEEEEGNGSSESDVEEHVEVERRLDHDLSRFEMIYPSYGGVGVGEYNYSYNNVLENRVDDQDSHIAQLEEENLTLKERLFLMERELGDLRRRLLFLEGQHGGGGSSAGGQGNSVAVVEEDVSENVSDNDENGNESDGGCDVGATSHEEKVECMDGKKHTGSDVEGECNDACMEKNVGNDEVAVKDDKEGTEIILTNEATVQDNEITDGNRGYSSVLSINSDLVKEDMAE
ncbi:hypothetical protein K2173_011020 [Erythroxylum novogranatense]|uniref:PRLI-interacting factor A n=1 Tax=Erythroxylum novogranatense TaxID=1862640 RepID=A0AAV8T1J6_9ROSI|nr:hypothetical protein K2173_011020 [Erythroxylum novogranatense]